MCGGGIGAPRNWILKLGNFSYLQGSDFGNEMVGPEPGRIFYGVRNVSFLYLFGVVFKYGLGSVWVSFWELLGIAIGPKFASQKKKLASGMRFDGFPEILLPAS